jgi:hypothetical protein
MAFVNFEEIGLAACTHVYTNTLKGGEKDVTILVVRRNSGCGTWPRRLCSIPVDIAVDRRAYSGVTMDASGISCRQAI